MATTEFRPGDSINLGLFIQAVATFDLAVEWIGPDGQIITQQMLTIPASDNGTRITQSMASCAIYEYTPPGKYQVEVYDPAQETNRTRFEVGRVTKSKQLSAPRKIETPQEVTLGEGEIQFLGYRVQTGKTLTLDLYWQAAQWLNKDYTVFVHLLGPYNPVTGGPVWAQDDTFPLDGGHPTTRWQPGQIVPDRHMLEVPANMPPGTYQIEIGLYNALNGERLEIETSNENRILLKNIHIRKEQ